MNLRGDDTFVEDEGWHRAADRYGAFLRRHKGMRVLYLELGVGGNTPGIIKYPFWKMVRENPNGAYASINLYDIRCPVAIESQAVGIQGDIGAVLKQL